MTVVPPTLQLEVMHQDAPRARRCTADHQLVRYVRRRADRSRCGSSRCRWWGAEIDVWQVVSHLAQVDPDMRRVSQAVHSEVTCSVSRWN